MKCKTIPGVAISACAVLLLAVSANAKDSIDYQKLADGARWGWQEEMANPLACVRQCGDKYDVSLSSRKDNRHVLTITVLLGNRPVYSWQGHEHSVFAITGDRLYYANFHPSSDGGNIVAVDLKTGKELWTSQLKGLGGILHSAYRNLMTLSADDDSVEIFGNESMGRYFEIKKAATGETVGHKLFPMETSGGTNTPAVAEKPPRADDQSLIPAPLNSLIPKISAGMTPAQLQKLLSTVYPKVEERIGDWSGGTGYIDFKLEDRYSISISGRSDAKGRPVVHEDIFMYVFDHPQRSRIEIKKYHWKDSSEPKPQVEGKKEQPPEEWFVDRIKEAKSVQVGMTRSQLLKVFEAEEEADILPPKHAKSEGFGLKSCPHIEVRVDFQKDKITSISEPYFVWNDHHISSRTWVLDRWAEATSIKAGMTQAQLLKAFEEEGGLQSIPADRYVLKSCPYVKVNAHFKDGKIADISAPYLGLRVVD